MTAFLRVSDAIVRSSSADVRAGISIILVMNFFNDTVTAAVMI